MTLQVAGNQTTGYRISMELYEGPLDLLLDLIERAELDITKLALAQVTDQYLDYMKHLEVRNATEVSAFLVIAAKLIQIKSAALLPRPTLDPSLEPEEDTAEALARQLIIYKRFKELAGFIASREEAGLHTYLRLAPPAITVQAQLDLSDVTLEDLVAVAREIFFDRSNLPPLSQVVSMQRVTIREKIQTILSTLKTDGKASFRNLLSGNSTKVEVVVTFLAMLELIKRYMVEVEQDNLFGDIRVQSLEPIGENTTVEEIEFDE